MNLGYARGYQLTQQLDLLEDYLVDELFSDGHEDAEALFSSASEFQGLLDFSKPGDAVVVASFEVLSRDYQQLVECLKQLEQLDVELVVLNMPRLSVIEWQHIFRWAVYNERLLHPQLVKAGKERSRSRSAYSLFSREPEARKLYREIVWLIVEKLSIRQIAQRKRVPVETVYRIQQQIKQLQLAAVLVICFLLAIFSIKLVESYFDQVWLQVLICVVVTLIILWNVLVDTTKEEQQPKEKQSKK